jgi:hypothetical protein
MVRAVIPAFMARECEDGDLNGGVRHSDDRLLASGNRRSDSVISRLTFPLSIGQRRSVTLTYAIRFRLPPQTPTMQPSLGVGRLLLTPGQVALQTFIIILSINTVAADI